MTLLLLAACQTGTDGKPAGDSGTTEETGTGDTETGSDSDTDAGGTGILGDTDTAATDTGLRTVSDADCILVASDPFGEPPDMPIAADWDGNGTLDLGVTLYRGTTERGGRDGVAYRLDNLEQQGWVDLGTVTERFLGTGESAGLALYDALDVDGDGYEDAVLYETTADSSGHVAVLLGPFAGDVTIDSGRLSLWGAQPGDNFGNFDVVTGDLTGNGDVDLAVSTPVLTAPPGTYSSGIAIFPASATGSYSSDQASAWIGCSNEDDCTLFGAWTTTVADVDGDGMNDLLVPSWYAAQYAGKVFLFDGPFDGERLESDADALRVGPEGSQFGSDLAVCDFNGDGRLDVAVAAGSDDTSAENGGTIFIETDSFSGMGDAAVLAQTTLHGTEDRWLGWIDAGDLDGDGRCDLMASVQERDYRADLYLWTELPSGVSDYASGRPIIAGEDDGDLVSPMAATDLDGDGRADPVVWFDVGEQGAMGLFHGLEF